MRAARTVQHQDALNLSYRRLKFDRIADPLWQAIARDHVAEAAHLMIKLQALVDADRERKAS